MIGAPVGECEITCGGGCGWPFAELPLVELLLEYAKEGGVTGGGGGQKVPAGPRGPEDHGAIITAAGKPCEGCVCVYVCVRIKCLRI